MKKIAITFTCLVVFTLLASAQATYQIGESLDFFRSYKMQQGEYSLLLNESDIEGSPYLNDEFINGTIYTTSKTQYQNIPLRFNIFNDNLEFKTPDDAVMSIAVPEIVESAEFGEYKMCYIPYTISKKIKRGFLIELVSDHVSLYAKPEVLYKKPQEPAPYKEAEPAKFLPKADSYYLRAGKEEAQKITGKKDLIQSFPDHQKEVTDFIKKNKINPTKESDLIKLVNFYNSL
ncbi:hypothetical protein [uncultured Draconibacterium sp.]|uniref:hypothetical protein n=1 Tax=uncultured Draconibacterium sp. TaxID=1573823 RepID=UPI00321689FC